MKTLFVIIAVFSGGEQQIGNYQSFDACMEELVRNARPVAMLAPGFLRATCEERPAEEAT